MSNLLSLKYFLPEIFITVAILYLLVSSLFKFRLKDLAIYIIGIIAVIASGAIQYSIISLPAASIFRDMIVFDNLSLFFRFLFLIVALIAIFLSMSSEDTFGSADSNKDSGEYLLLIFTMILGMMLMASSNNFLMLYLAIEMVSLPSYILTGFLIDNKKGSEASLKYVIYGGVASGIMVFGMSLLYGFCGTLSFAGVNLFLTANNINNLYFFVCMILILAGIGFKIAAVPFHMWCPDVYEGAPTPITALLSVGPKAAGFAVFIRIFYGVFSSQMESGYFYLTTVDWPYILAVISAITMSVGNLVALTQTNIKRLLAYSSIAHAGYMLMGISVISKAGIDAVLFYLAIYMIMNLGAFLVVIMIANKFGAEDLSAYKGLAWKTPYLAFAAVVFAIFLFSLTGIPPFAGFIGKVYLFAAVIAKGSSYYWLALIGVLNSVISLYYYARVVKTMFLDKPEEGTLVPSYKIMSLSSVVVLVLAVSILVFGLYWEPIITMAVKGANFLG